MTAHKRTSLFTLVVLFAALSQSALAQWQDYDESADLALLAEHDNPSMRFTRLNSLSRDKNSLWAPFTDQLSDFNAADYAALKPLILEQDVASLQGAVAAGQLSYETLTKFYIYRIREIESDPERYLNGVIALNPQAIRRAAALDQRRQAEPDAERSAVFGMPVLLKDNIGFAGLPTTVGAIALENNITADAFISERLQANGAIILGKANLSEWAYFFCEDCPSGYTALGGQTLNPYGRFEYGTGGSSSGSAASAAANYATLTVGSETSGSILSPASANSLVGFKPTTGSLSRTGIVPISASLDTAGPITRSVADAVVMFNAMAGYDQADSAMPLISEDFSLQYRVQDLSGKRIGVIRGFLENEHYKSATEVLAANGATTIEIEFSPERDARFLQLLGGEMVRDLALYLNTFAAPAVSIKSIVDLKAFNEADMDTRAHYGQELVDMMAELSLTVAELETIRSQMQAAATQQLEQLFIAHDLDVLVSVNNYTAGIAALANYPALTIPMGYEDDGKPVGLTLFAPAFNDQELIDVGAAFENLSSSREIPIEYQ